VPTEEYMDGDGDVWLPVVNVVIGIDSEFDVECKCGADGLISPTG
jgi:hypothetical protein